MLRRGEKGEGATLNRFINKQQLTKVSKRRGEKEKKEDKLSVVLCCVLCYGSAPKEKDNLETIDLGSSSTFVELQVCDRNGNWNLDTGRLPQSTSKHTIHGRALALE